MLTHSPLHFEMHAEMHAQEIERALRSRRPEWYGSAGPLEGPSLRRGVGRLLISAGTWLSGAREA